MSESESEAVNKEIHVRNEEVMCRRLDVGEQICPGDVFAEHVTDEDGDLVYAADEVEVMESGDSAIGCEVEDWDHGDWWRPHFLEAAK